MTTVTANGQTYSDDGTAANDLLGGGHRQHLLPLFNAALTELESKRAAASTSATAAATSASSAAGYGGAAISGTSTSAVAVGTGSKTWTTQTGRTFTVGHWVYAWSSAAAYMLGQVTAYNSGTGALTINVTEALGSGSPAS